MTSDCAGDQISHGPDGSTLVQATGAIGSHDHLNEAPRKKYQCLSLHREILTEIYEDGFVLNYGQIVALLNSRDGQPTPSR